MTIKYNLLIKLTTIWIQHRCAVSTESETSVKDAYFFLFLLMKGREEKKTNDMPLAISFCPPWAVARGRPFFSGSSCDHQSPNPHVSAPSADADGFSGRTVRAGRVRLVAKEDRS